VRRTKVVCTIGPASSDRVAELVAAGMDVARLNFSHGTESDHRRNAASVGAAAGELGRNVAILADLPGPKVRLRELVGGTVTLRDGARLLLRHDRAPGDATAVSTTHARLGEELRAGDRVLLADGAAELQVLRSGDPVETEVVRGGTIRSGAGVNIPSERLSLPAVSDRDRQALAVALSLGADYIAASFVRRAEDLRELRALLGHHRVGLVAKLETRAALDDLDAILHEADAVMVARGDLGVEIPYEEIPVLQKAIVARALQLGRSSIVATQMLESMTDHPRPTRAEASDAATAVLDGADAVMLSAETAIGRFPLEAVEAAARICAYAEAHGGRYATPPDRAAAAPLRPPGEQAASSAATGTPQELDASEEAAWAIATAAADLAERDAGVGAIAVHTTSGRSAELVACARPRLPILAFAADPAVVRRLALRRGVTAMQAAQPADTDEVADLVRTRRESELAALAGRSIVIVAASPIGRARTNVLRVEQLD
jgi:pyruvate kinase